MSVCQLTMLFYIPVNVYMSLLDTSPQLIWNAIGLGFPIIIPCRETRVSLFLYCMANFSNLS